MWAASENHMNVLKLLLEKGAYVDITTEVSQTVSNNVEHNVVLSDSVQVIFDPILYV
jgi:ankyrin repeat protein